MTLKILEGIWNVGSKAGKSIVEEVSLANDALRDSKAFGRIINCIFMSMISVYGPLRVTFEFFGMTAN